MSSVKKRHKNFHQFAFSTTSGQYQYQVMPYRLTSGPSVFQNFINKALREFLGGFIIVYIENILIYSPNYKQHVSHVCHVLLKF